MNESQNAETQVGSADDPYQGNVTDDDLESQTRAAEGETPGGEAKPDAGAEKPDGDGKGEGEAEKDGEGEKEEAGKDSDTEGKPDPEKDGEAEGDGEEDGALPDDPDATSRLMRNIASHQKRIKDLQATASKQGQRATDAENKVTELQDQIEQVQSGKSLAKMLLDKQPDLADRLAKALKGEAFEPAKGGKEQGKEPLSDEQLDVLAEVEEVAPLVEFARSEHAARVKLESMVGEFNKRLDSIEQGTNQVRKEEVAAKVTERRFDQYNHLHENYPELAIPKDLDAETVQEMAENGEIDADDPKWKPILARCKLAHNIVQFAETGPHNKGTAEEPYYPDIDTAYEVLNRKSGKAYSRAARNRIAGRKEAAEALSNAGKRKPGVQDIAGKNAPPESKSFKGKEDAQKYLDNLQALIDKDGRDMTDKESEKYDTALRIVEGD